MGIPAAYISPQPCIASPIPARFLRLADDRILPWTSGAAAILLVVGLYLGLFVAPDYRQGSRVRIMSVHVRAAWTAILVYASWRWQAPSL